MTPRHRCDRLTWTKEAVMSSDGERTVPEWMQTEICDRRHIRKVRGVWRVGSKQAEPDGTIHHPTPVQHAACIVVPRSMQRSEVHHIVNKCPDTLVFWGQPDGLELLTDDQLEGYGLMSQKRHNVLLDRALRHKDKTIESLRRRITRLERMRREETEE